MNYYTPLPPCTTTADQSGRPILLPEDRLLRWREAIQEGVQCTLILPGTEVELSSLIASLSSKNRAAVKEMQLAQLNTCMKINN